MGVPCSFCPYFLAMLQGPILLEHFLHIYNSPSSSPVQSNSQSCFNKAQGFFRFLVQAFLCGCVQQTLALFTSSRFQSKLAGGLWKERRSEGPPAFSLSPSRVGKACNSALVVRWPLQWRDTRSVRRHCEEEVGVAEGSRKQSMFTGKSRGHGDGCQVVGRPPVLVDRHQFSLANAEVGVGFGVEVGAFRCSRRVRSGEVRSEG